MNGDFLNLTKSKSIHWIYPPFILKKVKKKKRSKSMDGEYEEAKNK